MQVFSNNRIVIGAYNSHVSLMNQSGLAHVSKKFISRGMVGAQVGMYDVVCMA